ncbi:MAG: NHLP-related RiPP peptide [Xanthomonadales bacterium]|nr:NHLP-related RiPP peptide [Xanthomonadales bacterium]
MTDTMLSKDQAIALLQKLSTDDAFRASYEKSPGEALLAAGISAEVIKSLPRENLAPHKLNSKEAFAASLQQVRSESANVHLCLRVPTVKLSGGSKDSAGSTSFSAS